MSTASVGRTASLVAAAQQASGTTITETGSTLLYPLAGTWAKAYHQQHPGVTVTTAGTGSGAGIEDASDGAADIGASDAYPSSGDLVKNPALLNIPLAISAQTVIYNVPGLPPGSHLELDGTVLAQIYSGAITMWNDPAIKALNKTLPLPPIAIAPVHRSDSSGDTFLFTSYLSTRDPGWDASIGYGTTADWPPVVGAKAEKGSLNVLQACATTPGCVACNGISYLAQASIDVQRIRGDAVLNVISRSGDASFQSDFTTISGEVGPGRLGLLALTWYTANAQVYRLGAAADYAGERAKVIGTGTDSSAAGYDALESDISQAISDDQSAFRTAVPAGSAALAEYR